MKIAGFDTRVVSVPRAEGSLGGRPGDNVATFVTLKMHTDDGIEGIGYAGFASNVVVKALKETVDALAGLTVGEGRGGRETLPREANYSSNSPARRLR